MRLIDANALMGTCRATLMVDVFPNWRNMPNNEKNVAVKIGTAFKRIHENAPTVDAVEVVHGRWEWLGPNRLVPECMCGTCSACKVRSKYIVNTDICPNCGAKMDGDGNG